MTVAGTTALAGLRSTKVLVVSVAALIASLNVAVTGVVGGTPDAPPAGDTDTTVGGTLSLETVTETAADVLRLPDVSRAIAVSVCDPFVTVLEFQDSA